MELKENKNIWHKSTELKSGFSKFNKILNRLIILDNLWQNLLKNRAKFWVLDAVQGDTLLVKVKSSTARHELLLKEKDIIKNLNKNFDTPWIKKISII